MKKSEKKELIKDFDLLFSDDTECLNLLAKIKWGNEFVCKKCANTNYCEGKTPYSRRCTRCKHDESATAHTIFHNVKFPVSKAFYIAYQICNENIKISTYEFARRLSLRQMTCWKFKDKVMKAMDADEILENSDKEILKKMFMG